MAQQRTSSIPQVKAALVAVFTGALANEGAGGTPIQVAYGQPRDQERECVIVGETVNVETQTWSALGALRREETYALHVIIDVRADHTTQQAATERGFDILASLENSLRADLRAGLTGTFARLELEVDQAGLQEAANPDGAGYWARVSWAVKATVRI